MLLADGLADRWGLADRLERGSLAVIVKRSPRFAGGIVSSGRGGC